MPFETFRTRDGLVVRIERPSQKALKQLGVELVAHRVAKPGNTVLPMSVLPYQVVCKPHGTRTAYWIVRPRTAKRPSKRPSRRR